MAGGWRAKGLLFENCNCAVICPGHVHFSQNCTNSECIGYWAVRVDEGEIDSVSLAGLRAVVIFSAPQRMIDGGWRQVIIMDESQPQDARDKLDAVLKGERGGPWTVLARFVAERYPTVAGKIEFVDDGKVKTVKVDGMLDSTIEAIQGRDRSSVVTLENMFNQIHPPSQVVARGNATSTHPQLPFDNKMTHGLYSNFDWQVAG